MDLVITSALGLEAVLDLANTIHGPGGHYRRRARDGEPDHDHMDTPGEAAAFLAGHTVPVPDGLPDARQLSRLREIRDLARDLAPLDPRPASSDWDAAVGRLMGTYRLTPDGSLRSTAPGWDGLCEDLLPPLLRLRDERQRIRVCGNDRCRWLFVDRSRNQSRRWCEMAVCGNRVKVGRYRHRLVDATA